MRKFQLLWNLVSVIAQLSHFGGCYFSHCSNSFDRKVEVARLLLLLSTVFPSWPLPGQFSICISFIFTFKNDLGNKYTDDVIFYPYNMVRNYPSAITEFAELSVIHNLDMCSLKKRWVSNSNPPILAFQYQAMWSSWAESNKLLTWSKCVSCILSKHNMYASVSTFKSQYAPNYFVEPRIVSWGTGSVTVKLHFDMVWRIINSHCPKSYTRWPSSSRRVSHVCKINAYRSDVIVSWSSQSGVDLSWQLNQENHWEFTQSN